MAVKVSGSAGRQARARRDSSTCVDRREYLLPGSVVQASVLHQLASIEPTRFVCHRSVLSKSVVFAHLDLT